MDTDEFPVNPGIISQFSLFFSCERVSVISTELTSIPKNCIFWHGSNTDFLRFIEKPEEDISECPLQVSASPSRKPAAEYGPEK